MAGAIAKTIVTTAIRDAVRPINVLYVIHFGRMRRSLAAAAALIVLPHALRAQPSTIDTAFAKFFAAGGTAEAARAAEDLVRTGVSFEDALSRLRLGR